MKRIKGYAGKLIRVNLSKDFVETIEMDWEAARKYIGGSGLGTYYFLKETNPQVEPLDEKNTVVFMTGPFTGTCVPTSGRNAVVSKSPLTNAFAESDVGGRWGAALKKAGYDGIIVTGKAPKPVYLFIDDEKVELRNAEHIWGKDTFETSELLKSETSNSAVISSIGPSGEKQIRIANIINDGSDARAAGRCGLGAVLGSKKLKAIAVSGKNDVKVSDPENLRTETAKVARMLGENMKGLREYGTGGGMANVEAVGDLPIKNWKQGSWSEEVKKITGKQVKELGYVSRNFHCGSCPIGCGKVVHLDENERFGPIDGAGPEYESLALLGSMLLIDDINAIIKAADVCNRNGVDTISAGAVCAFAIEAYEKGAIGQDRTDDMDLEWGSLDTLFYLLEKIVVAEGIGEILSKGVREASRELGVSGSDYVLHVKGLELPGHDPRAYNSVGLGYATSHRGACHVSALTHVFERSATLPELGYTEVQDRFGVEGKGKFVADLQDLMAVFDSLKMCKFALMGGLKLQDILGWYKCVTGMEMALDDLKECGERINNLKRMFNYACGMRKEDDTLPERILKLKRETGGAAENLPPLEKMLPQYYEARGWGEKGVPAMETLDRLQLGEFAYLISD